MDRRKVEKAAERRIANVKDYKQVFSSLAGARVLHDLMLAHHMLNTTFDEKSVERTVLREGERNVVLRILSILKMNPEQLREHVRKHLEENDL